MLYVVLKTDIRSKEGRVYAKKGKKIPVLYVNDTHYVCDVGKFNVPVFPGQVSMEVTTKEDEEIEGLVEEPESEGTGGEGSCPDEED